MAQIAGMLGQQGAPRRPTLAGAALSTLGQVGEQSRAREERGAAERARREALFGDIGSMFG